MQVELESVLARKVWQLYWTERSPISRLLFALDPVHISKTDRGLVAGLIRDLAEEMAHLEEQKQKDKDAAAKGK